MITCGLEKQRFALCDRKSRLRFRVSSKRGKIEGADVARPGSWFLVPGVWRRQPRTTCP
jgi:hypothetical protein